ncbi:MAG: hypothetical protein K6G10_01570 [Butyrivibrio sp.]|nr:hypothetical protein [Butyrivibrio sp.]
MKLLIEISDELHSLVQDRLNCCGEFKEADARALMCAVDGGIVIPDNATNGKAIQKMFKGLDAERRDDVVDVYGLSSFSVTFTQEWWDTPYKYNKNFRWN